MTEVINETADTVELMDCGKASERTQGLPFLLTFEFSSASLGQTRSRIRAKP